jgi:ferritin
MPSSTCVKALVGVAVSEQDEATETFLPWYLDEQMEEEESSDTVLKKVIAAGENQNALTVVDK